MERSRADGAYILFRLALSSPLAMYLVGLATVCEP